MKESKNKKFNDKKKVKPKKKSAILFVHGAPYFGSAQSTPVFEKKILTDFKDWTKIQQDNTKYSFIKDQTIVDVILHRWVENAPFLSKSLLSEKLINGFKTLLYFFKPNWLITPKLKFLFSSSVFLVLLWYIDIILFFIAGFTSLVKSEKEKADFYGKIVEYTTNIYESHRTIWITFCTAVLLLRYLIPIHDIMNLAFFIYAYDTNLSIDGVDCKSNLTLRLEKEILELLKKDYHKIIIVGHSIGGILITDSIQGLLEIDDKTIYKSYKKLIKSKIKVITVGSMHGFLKDSNIKSDIFSKENWDYYYSEEDFFSTLLPDGFANIIKKNYHWGFISHLMGHAHIRYLEKIDYIEKVL